MNWYNRISRELHLQIENYAWRKRPIVEYSNTRWLVSQGRKYLNFSSNDYLGLSQNSKIIQSWVQGIDNLGTSTASSTHVTGYRSQQAQLEIELANWLGYNSALLFISGFAANQAVIYLLAKKNDLILADKLIHASLIEAAHYSPAQLIRFQHNNVENLINNLKLSTQSNILVITEGIFSMDGDSAPLREINYQTYSNNAWLIVDDAHGIGVVGKNGRGSCWQQQVKPEILIITFSKAFGISGAALLCDQPIADYFIQFSRHLQYTTAIPTAQISALLTSLKEIQKADHLRYKLQQNIKQFIEGAKKLPWLLTNSKSAIQSLIIGKNSCALLLESYLHNAGLWITAIRPPTVPKGTARLRITLSAVHEPKDIDKLLRILHHASFK